MVGFRNNFSRCRYSIYLHRVQGKITNPGCSFDVSRSVTSGNERAGKIDMYVCTGLRTKIACTNYKVVGLQPQIVAIPDLYFGCPCVLFKSKNEVFMTMTRDYINIACTIYDTNTTYVYKRRAYTWGTE